jgi:predicted RNA-binding protein with PIN domain
MGILIDGYNLMHAAGLMPRRLGPGTLGRRRRTLINLLANRLSPEHVASTTVVFDARNAPSDAEPATVEKGITIRYAVEQAEADDLIEDLIRHDSAPRALVVVSGDRRIQRAARRRGARAMNGEEFRTLLEALPCQPSESASPPVTSDKPQRELSTTEVADWLQEFGLGHGPLGRPRDN